MLFKNIMFFILRIKNYFFSFKDKNMYLYVQGQKTILLFFSMKYDFSLLKNKKLFF